jgi:hypothetical protein
MYIDLSAFWDLNYLTGIKLTYNNNNEVKYIRFNKNLLKDVAHLCP